MSLSIIKQIIEVIFQISFLAHLMFKLLKNLLDNYLIINLNIIQFHHQEIIGLEDELIFMEKSLI